MNSFGFGAWVKSLSEGFRLVHLRILHAVRV